MSDHENHDADAHGHDDHGDHDDHHEPGGRDLYLVCPTSEPLKKKTDVGLSYLVFMLLIILCVALVRFLG